MKAEDNLEVAKLEALRLAANNRADYFILDLATGQTLYQTEPTRRATR